ncbi:Bug family tripartite tricarboxylate transporter substrate binding protein [Verticiella alkaliphila]|uniref:Bug family tripartite tricarboxylate transporter substrate binding protein n=1 Tax=Verticiella alkaliphila TaxID=2779529 RepID=UPI003530303C
MVENRPGADSTIAANTVAKADPDGYTFVLGTNSAMVAMPSRSDAVVNYDPFKDFTPISSAGQFSMFLVVNPQLPVKTVDELLAFAKANPGKLNSASSNSASELAMVQLLAKADAKALNVRYKGDVPALTDLMSGRVNLLFTTGTSAPSLVKDGRARALFTLQPERSPLLPDVPTASEVGVDQITILPWAGFFGPAGMPADVTATLSEALQKTLSDPEVRRQLAEQGFEGYGMSPQQFTTFFRERYDGWVTTIRDNNIVFE